MKKIVSLLIVIVMIFSTVSTAMAVENTDENYNVNYPQITNIATGSKGFTVSFTEYEGAATYRLFIKKSTGSGWTKVADSQSTTIKHINLVSGTDYTYTVRALDAFGKYISEYNTQGYTKTYIAPPVVKAECAYEGIKISWNKVAGAQNYKVFIKKDSKWKTLATTTATSYTDYNVEPNKTYSYTVRCVSADGSVNTSFYNKTGKSCKYIEAPQITKISNGAKGTTVTWNKVSGASKYRLFYKNSSGKGWTKIKDTTSTSATHTTLKSNSTYTYTVRALNSDGTYASYYNSSGWTKTYIAPPTITSVESTYGGIKISWNKVAGAQNYKVFIKKDSKWKTLSTTTATSYTDYNVEPNKTYSYTVRCVSADGSVNTSFYNKTGKSCKYIQAPEITKFTNGAKGTKVTWDKVSGASKYRLFYKNSSGSGWTKIADTTNNYANHLGIADGSTYTYTVRAMNSSGSYISGYYTTGWTNRYIAPPQITSVTSSANGMYINWEYVETAKKYRVYRKEFGGSYIGIADVSANYFTDTNAPQNTLYAYTLRCLDENSNTISYYLTNTAYYYNNALANGKITHNGVTYNFVDGFIRQGYVKIDGKTYYYNSNGVVEKNGIVGSSKDGYRYADKNGVIDYTYRNAVTQDGVDWNVLDGIATKVKTEADKTLFRALKLMNKICDKDMTKSQKLKKCWDYVKSAYIEENPRIPHYKGMDWPVIYANDMFVNGRGNCFSYGACFAYLAKAIGYEEVYCCHSGGHGWAEIDGLIYDPEWSRHHSGYTYYGMSYDAPCDVDYKGAMSAATSWMHVKI